MPKIRKKTSKRGTTHQRSKIKHKVSESRKKSKKEAKKNPQWKSKHAKDPGIPNNFPYKDQILAEVAEQRRQEEELKRKRKEEKKQTKSADADDKNEAEGTAFDGISSVGSSTIRAATTSAKGKAKADVIDSEEDDDTPILMDSEYENFKSILDKADIIVQVLDARDPLAFESKDLQNHVKQKQNSKLIYVLAKIDTCPRESTQGWATRLRNSHPVFFFRSASAFLPTEVSGDSSKKDDAVGADVLLKALHLSTGGDKVHVAIVGIGNSGKSSLLNSLLGKSVSPIHKSSSAPPTPSTTVRPLEVPFDYDGKQFIFIDTPAIIWERSENLTLDQAVTFRSRDVLLRSKGKIERIKDPIAPISYIISRADVQDLMVFYNLPAFTKGDTTAFLSALAKKHSLVKKKGVLDLQNAARIVLRDWNTGKFARYVQPLDKDETTPDSKPDRSYAELYERDSSLLQTAPSRKDMRKGDGLIRLSVEDADPRPIVVEEPWDIPDSDDDESADDSDGLGSDEIGDEEVDEGLDSDFPSDDEVEEDGGEDSEEVVNVGKRKRQPKQAKKVAFAPVRNAPNSVRSSKSTTKPAFKKRR